MLQEWLKSIGLDHRLAAFEAHEISRTDLEALSEADLRELGLTIGERKRFRRALAMGAHETGSGERRPLALVFFDLVNSTRLGEELETEDMVDLLRLYRERCREAVERFGGHLVHLLGDGVLACFGYPKAQGNDSERAVRAALDVAAGVARLETPAKRPLAVRCGVATGRVVVTELFSGRGLESGAFTGSAANLAARLQSRAPEDGVVLSESTALRVRHLFVLADMGAHRLKGFADPVRSFLVVSPRARPQAAEDAEASAFTPLVGREAELGRLRRLWSETLGGAGRAVFVRGEPGMGKSRLVARFLRSLDGTGAAMMRAHASDLDASSPLRPFVEYFLHRPEALDGASRTALSDALSAATGIEAGRPRRRGGAGGTAGGDAAQAATPERRAVALRTLADHFAEEAGRRPALLLVEDAQWLDASSRELLALVVERARVRRLMVVVTSRVAPHEILPGIEPEGIEDLPLAPLGRDAVRRMAAAAFGDEPPPLELLARVEERSDGVPLFVEELLRAVLRSSRSPPREGEKDRPAAVPETLEEALAARLDQLGPLKAVAQAAAVLGRSVSLPTLARVMERGEAVAARALDALRAAGVLRFDPGPSGGRWVFTHALLRDAAYDGLLREQRQRLHRLAAGALRALEPALADERPDILAWHLAESGRPAEALPFWLAAGRSAAARSALREARQSLERGAAIAAELPETPELIETRLEFAALLGPVFFALCGPNSRESRAIYETALSLVEAASESKPHFALLWGWWRLSRDFRAKAERARKLLALAEKRGDAEMRLQALHCNWASAFHAGEFDACRTHIEEGLVLYARGDCEQRPWLFGNHDAKVCAHGELAQVLWMQGRPAEACAQEAEALAWAEGRDHAGTQAHALDTALLHRYYRREPAEVRRFAERLIRLAEDRGLAEFTARARLFLGWSLARQGDPDFAMRIFEESYRRQRDIGTDEDTPVYACMFAEILNRLGRCDQALRDLHEVREGLERLSIHNWMSEIWRLIGETALLADAAALDAAREAFDAADRIAAEQGVVMLRLRAALSRAALPDEAAAAQGLADAARLREAVVGGAGCAEIRLADALLGRERNGGDPLRRRRA